MPSEHEFDCNSRFLEVCLFQNGTQRVVDDDEVVTAAVTLNGVLLNSELVCTANKAGNIVVPISDESIGLEAGVLSFEISVKSADCVLVLPYPIEITVNGSIIRNAQIGEMTRGSLVEVISGKADIDSVYSKSQVDSLLSDKLDKNEDISSAVFEAAKLLQPVVVDSLSEMTDTDLLYVYNGTLWQYRTVAVPAYTNHSDPEHWSLNCRLNSSGKAVALSGSSVSNFIPVKAGDVIRVKGWNFTLTPQFYSYVDGYSAADEITFLGGVAVSTNAVGSGNSSFAYERIETLADGTIQYTAALNNAGSNCLSSSCNYVRISGTSPSDPSGVIITVNEVMGGATVNETRWVDTGISYSGSVLSEDVAALGNRVENTMSNVAQLGARVSALEQDTSCLTVPDFWESAVASAESEVLSLQNAAGNDAVNFLLFSDMHIDSQGTNYAHNIGVLARRLMNDLSIPVCVNAGDINNRNSEASKEAVMEDVAEAKRILAPIGSDRLLTCRGNHDLYYGNPAYTKGFSANELYNLIYRDQAMDVKRVFGEGGTYYYADCIAQKMRYIVLDCHTSEYSVSADGSMSFDAYNKNGYGNAQLNWLAHTALDLPEGWTAAVIQHCPPTYGYAKSASTGYGIRDLGVFVGIVNAFCNKTSYSGSYTHDAQNGEGEWADVSVSCDFSGADGWICGIFCGHRHTDSIYTSPTVCPIIVITCAKSGSSAFENPRIYSTATETAIDIVTVNRTDRTVTMTRLGVCTEGQQDENGNRTAYCCSEA